MQKAKQSTLRLELLLLCLLLGLTACQAADSPAEVELILEEYALEGPPEPDSLVFQPIGTTQDTVLEKRKAEREKVISNPYKYVSGDNYPRLDSLGPGQGFTSVLQPAPGEPDRQTIVLLKGEEVIFSVDAGLPSPALPLQGLWSFENHWVLEVLHTEGEIREGRIYQDGVLLNTELEYWDVFGYQLLAGKPFFFYQNDNGLGYSYDGQETSLSYEIILHYGCCSAYILNPVQSENMVAFFAIMGEDWYYIELGAFSPD